MYKLNHFLNLITNTIISGTITKEKLFLIVDGIIRIIGSIIDQPKLQAVQSVLQSTSSFSFFYRGLFFLSYYDMLQTFQREARNPYCRFRYHKIALISLSVVTEAEYVPVASVCVIFIN